MKKGVHILKFKGIVDGGGCTVVGITKNTYLGETYDQVIGLASNTYQGGNDLGNWSNTLYWSENVEVEFVLNCDLGTLVCTNLGDQTSTTFTFNYKDELITND